MQRRSAPRDATLLIADVFPIAAAPRDIFADLPEVRIDDVAGNGIRPGSCGGVEDHLDLRVVQRGRAQQRAQRRVDVRDHHAEAAVQGHGAARAERVAGGEAGVAPSGNRGLGRGCPCARRGRCVPVRLSSEPRVPSVRRLRMPTYLSPGVYVQEVSSGSKPIEGVGTAVAAFVGLTEKGPANTPTLVTNWTQFNTVFGDFVEGSYLAHAVYGYFLNGGGSAYVVRVGSDGAGEQPSARGELAAREEPGRAVCRIAAAEGGPACDDISVEIGAPGEAGEDTFKVTVSRGGKVEET